MIRPIAARTLPAVASLVLLGSAGCAALAPPARQSVTLGQTAPVVGLPGESAGDWPAAQWWRAYDDPALTQLVDAALARAPGIAGAEARVRAAEQDVLVAGAALGLGVNASAQYERRRLSDNALLPTSLLGFNWYDQSDLGVALRYQFDWWGRQRAAIEAAIDRTRARAAEREAAAIGIAAAVATAYFGWQADTARAELLREEAALLQQAIGVHEKRHAAGLEDADGARRTALQLAQRRSDLAVAEGQRRLRVVALASLLGVDESGLPPLQPRPLPAVRTTLPADAGANLLARRPDIAASRWRVEAALRDTDRERAGFYPDVSLRALAALSSIDLGRLLRAGSAAPTFGAAVDLPLFDAGLRRARHGAALAALQAAIASYDEAVLNAAREAGSAAAALAQAAAQHEAAAARVAAAQSLRDAADARLRAGLVDRAPLLQAQVTLIEEREAAVRVAQAAVLADVQLKQALAGAPIAEEPTR